MAGRQFLVLRQSDLCLQLGIALLLTRHKSPAHTACPLSDTGSTAQRSYTNKALIVFMMQALGIHAYACRIYNTVNGRSKV